ncbi:LA_2272 family surface repeat-containing protein [Flavobacterium sp. RHBU_3]|uniref:LA_2272 family surface repeat-containing protein n=1 Tax=Flavobacterium sp. RHBU_3 TaxID=3391184 RepID=UPI003985149B
MKTKRILVLLLLVLAPATALAQKHKLRIPFGLYTTGNSDIYGISTGIGSDTYMDSDTVSVHSNGLRIEPISQSLLFFTLIFPIKHVNYPNQETAFADFNKKVPNEVINGINLSCGTNAFANLNGITVSATVQSLKNTNGISLAGISNSSYKNNGIQMSFFNTGSYYSKGLLVGGFQTGVYKGRRVHAAFWYNEYKYFDGFMISVANGCLSKPEEFRGLQLGVVNRTKKLKGIQIGLWNINEKRSLPIVNWNFNNKPPKPKKKRTTWINQSAKRNMNQQTHHN